VRTKYFPVLLQQIKEKETTSWAAKALLAKVYLTLGQADALPLLTDVITSGYSILTGTTGYSNVFGATQIKC
jgi:hypothetical protein